MGHTSHQCAQERSNRWSDFVAFASWRHLLSTEQERKTVLSEVLDLPVQGDMVLGYHE